MKIPSLFLILSLMYGCSSTGPRNEEAYNAALATASKNMKTASSGRTVASEASQNALAQNIDWEKLKAGGFTMVVFPKKSSITKKSITISDLELPKDEKESKARSRWKMATKRIIMAKRRVAWLAELVKQDIKTFKFEHPVEYTFIAKDAVSCGSLDKRQKMSSEDAADECVHIEVQQTYPVLNPDNYRNDDIINFSFYLSQKFKVFQVSEIKAGKNGRVKERVFRHSKGIPLSSGLSFLPVDLPNFSSKYTDVKSNEVGVNVLRLPQSLYIRNTLNEKNVDTCEEGVQVDFEDFLRGPIQLGICPNDPWPTSIETHKYFAVLKKN